jgi:hypothetical protein
MARNDRHGPADLKDASPPSVFIEGVGCPKETAGPDGALRLLDDRPGDEAIHVGLGWMGRAVAPRGADQNVDQAVGQPGEMTDRAGHGQTVLHRHQPGPQRVRGLVERR